VAKALLWLGDRWELPKTYFLPRTTILAGRVAALVNNKKRHLETLCLLYQYQQWSHNERIW
jgi:hypothetical protein